MSALKNLRGRFYPADTPLYDRDDDKILVAASGSYGGLGKIGTIAASGTLIVRCDCSDRAVSMLDWQVKIDKAWTAQLYRARANVTRATLTLADATVVDDGDTFILNGKTFTAEATEGDADPAAGKFWTGASNAAAAVNLCALINDETNGVPGVSAQVWPSGATDVIQLTTTTAPVIQFAQGTSDANEIAFADTTLTKLVKHGAPYSGLAANSTTDGETILQYLDGWPQAYLIITNGDGAQAATPVVRVTRY
jgi:hypothetical protein